MLILSSDWLHGAPYGTASHYEGITPADFANLLALHQYYQATTQRGNDAGR
jgi:hypothetical protein